MESKLNGKIKKIGILGGSFDPVHKGHLGLARDAMLQAELDKVIFIPARLQPFKLDKKLAEGEDRLNMLRLAINGYEGFEISTCELESNSISYTYLTLRYMQKLYGDDVKIHFITGTDTFIKIDKWKEGEELLKSYTFIVGARPGYKEEELKAFSQDVRQKFGTEIIIIDNERIDISSTEIRDAIQNSSKLGQLIPSEVERYIKDNGLYR